MTGTGTLPKSIGDKSGKYSRRGLLMLTLALVTICSSGCPVHRHAASRWQTAAQVRPKIPQLIPPAGDEPRDEVPNLEMEFPPVPRLASMRMAPTRPRTATNPVAVESGGTTMPVKPVEPIIAPQLSTQESEEARRLTQQSLDAAERNLSATRGKTLNAMQSDLASKVRGFMDDAREAMGNVDWTRARTLANKAQVLSEELARTL
jgi:hypothetical protein